MQFVAIVLLPPKREQAYWPFHKAVCYQHEFADVVERDEPKFAQWMRKHGKLATLKDDEIARLERARAAVSGPSAADVLNSMYNRLTPKPKPPSYAPPKSAPPRPPSVTVVGLPQTTQFRVAMVRYRHSLRYGLPDVQMETELVTYRALHSSAAHCEHQDCSTRPSSFVLVSSILDSAGLCGTEATFSDDRLGRRALYEWRIVQRNRGR